MVLKVLVSLGLLFLGITFKIKSAANLSSTLCAMCESFSLSAFAGKTYVISVNVFLQLIPTGRYCH